MVRTTILKKRINSMFKPGIVLTITYIKDLYPTQTFKDFISLIKMQN